MSARPEVSSPSGSGSSSNGQGPVLPALCLGDSSNRSAAGLSLGARDVAHAWDDLAEADAHGESSEARAPPREIGPFIRQPRAPGRVGYPRVVPLGHLSRSYGLSACDASVNSRNSPVIRKAVCSPMSTAWSP